MFKSTMLALVAVAGFALGSPALAQVTPIDPNDAGEYEPGAYQTPPAESEYQPVDPGVQDPWAVPAAPADTAPPAAIAPAPAPAVNADAIPREDIFTAAEGVFGRGAAGLAGMIENVLKDQGEPIAYITGQEAGGAFVLGVRYGSGTMRHQIEGDRAVYWTGPSIGFDFGADANKVFVLVYNLHDSEDLFKRYAGAEGNAYVLGGFTASYHRRGNVVLIPIRMGVGLRLGVNAGYMRFSENNRWLPF